MPIPRRKLVLYISLVLLGVALGLLFIFLIEGRNVRQDVSQTMIRDTAGVITDRFREVVAPVERDLQLTRKWGLSGMIDLADPKTLDDKFLPIMESQPILSGLILADSNGREYFLLRDNNAWLTRSAGPFDKNDQVVCMKRDDEGRLIKTWQESREYDPRERAWFKGILKGRFQRRHPLDQTVPIFYHQKSRHHRIRPMANPRHRRPDQRGRL